MDKTSSVCAVGGWPLVACAERFGQGLLDTISSSINSVGQSKAYALHYLILVATAGLRCKSKRRRSNQS